RGKPGTKVTLTIARKNETKPLGLHPQPRHPSRPNDAVKRMRGKPGTKVTLTIARKNETKPLGLHPQPRHPSRP
ncbi:hypothetical protein, partial [Aquitalea magnusonii]|uniref:hypothetical protein n=1 Tax=Aquitalea magnusonii TaxID=332411 RepID=UPI00195CD649